MLAAAADPARDAPGAETDDAPEVRLAPHRLRLLAFIADALIFAALIGLGFALVFIGGRSLANVGLWVLCAAAGIVYVYYLATTTWLMGQTAGKAVCGLSVRQIDGRPPGLVRSVGRHSLGYVIADVLLLGTVASLFTPRRRCPHDYGFGSEVVFMATDDRTTSPRTRYKEFWDDFSAKYGEMQGKYRWFFWPAKWLTAAVGLVSVWLGVLENAAGATVHSPAVSATPAAKPLGLAASAALWTTTAVATGVALVGISSAVPEREQIRNVDVVTSRVDLDSSGLRQPWTAEIYIMQADGDGIHPLTHNDAADDEPDLFSDRAIVFTSERDGNKNIYTMRADGTAQRRLTDDPDPDWCADWSPDGERIAFTSDRDRNSEIYVMNADGSGETRLTQQDAGDSCPDWSSDGARIAFASDRDGAANIYVMSTDGKGVVRVTDEGGYNPEWSPDMTTIVFASDRDGNPNVYVIGSDGRGERRLTDHPDADYRPFWAPDGSAILFESMRRLAQDASELYVMKPDGSEQTRLSFFND